MSPHRRRHEAAMVAVLALLALAPACRARARPVRVVLVTLDTLRHDALFGSPSRPSVMPKTLARARRGTTFDRFYAATSSTQPTHATLFTGLHPWQHGVSRNGLVLAAEHLTVAEVLREAGFGTSAVVGSFPVTTRLGFGQGFDAFEETLDEGRMDGGWEGVPAVEGHFYRLAPGVTEAALAQLDRSQAGRQFFWFHYYDPHAPYGDTTPGPRLRPAGLLRRLREGKDVRAEVERARELYEKDARSLDESLERLFARLDRDAATHETHVIVTADHGESFGEDGSLGHGRRVTAGQVHVPFFVLSPRMRPGARADVAGSVDVPATIEALAGLPRRAPGGRNLLDSAGGGARGMRRRFDDGAPELRLDGREYPLDADLFYAVGPDGLIHAGNARGIVPAEGSGGPAPAALQELFGSFERQLRGTERPRESNPEVERALEALGYVG